MAIRANRLAEGAPIQDVIRDPRLRTRSPRVERLYKLLQQRMDRKQKTWGTDLSVLDGPATAGLPLVVRQAKAFEKTLLEMPIAIEEDDLVVGNTVDEGMIVRPRKPGYATDEERAQAEREGKKIETGLSHKTPYYPDVMEKGLSGIIAEVDRKIADIQERPQSDERDEKLDFFQAMRIECKATIALAHRYADLAEGLAASAGTSERRAELLGIANVCRRVPEHPPSTFHEAVQAFWLVHYALFSTQTLISCGRPDQFLYPAFKKDMEAGSITLEQAQELIDCLWLRSNDRAQLQRENFFPGNGKNGDGDDNSFSSGVVIKPELREWPAGHRKRFMVPTDLADAINHWGQNLLLSGIRPDGTDGTNELTYLCLNAQEKFALTSPVVTARLHKDSPSELVHRTAEVLKSGGGMPYINNDDAIAQDYANLGVPLEDARDYANSNCWETMIQGRSDQELIRGVNFLLLLELALNRGYSHVHGERMGPDTGDPREFTGFRQLMEAWKTQMDHLVKQGIDYIGKGVVEGTLDHSSHGKYCYNPFLSSLTLDCIEKEMDVTRCGARYTIWHVMGEALANATDSMATIKKMVFEDGAVTMDELLTALEADWEGHENLRRMLVGRTPKFANDDAYADDIGRELMDYFVERTRLHAKRWHPTVIFPCSVGTFSWITSIGREVAATPDGRRAGEPVAANLSPAPGADTSGPTSAINSCVKMRSGDLAGGAPTDLRLSKSSLGGEAGTQRMVGLIKGFIDLGGNMLTLTVTDVEELKSAMEEPEKYRHLRVRMGGWSAYFVMLSREQQLLHIRRVEHGLA